MIKAIHLLDPFTERAAHDQPHHQLDAFQAELAQELERCDVRQGLRIRDQQFEETGVGLLVDESGPGDLATGAPHHDAQGFGVWRDRPTDRLAELVAAADRRRRVLDDRPMAAPTAGTCEVVNPEISSATILPLRE